MIPMVYTKLYVGDSLEVLPHIRSERGRELVDLIITSPPYNVGIDYASYDDTIPYYKYLEWMRDVWQACYDATKVGGRICVNIPITKQLPRRANIMVDIGHILQEVGWKYRDTVIWYKQNVPRRCLPFGSQVRVPNGYSEIQSLVKGDLVKTHMHRYRRVVNTGSNKDMIWSLSVYGLPDIYLSGNHPVLAIKGKHRKYPPQPEWINAEDLRFGDMLLYGIDSHIGNIPSYDIDQSLMYRLIGYYIGYGSIHRSVRLYLNKRNREDIDYLEDTWHGTLSVTESGDLRRLELRDGNYTINILKQFGTSAHEKHIVDWAMYSPLNLQEELIRGLWTSGGCFSDKDDCYTTVSLPLALGIRDLLLRFGIVSSIQRDYSIRSSTAYRIRIYHPIYRNRLRSITGKPLVDVSNSRPLIDIVGNNVLYPVRSSNESYFGTVYNLEVEEDGSFLGDITYHNTAWGSYGSPSDPWMVNPYECILIYHKIRQKHRQSDYKVDPDITEDEFKEWTNSWWQIQAENRLSGKHPAPFPEELPYRLIKFYSFPHDTIMDPFVGSGTTSLVARRLDRNSIGIELDEGYVQLALERIIGDTDVRPGTTAIDLPFAKLYEVH